jgi:hypothetical protein
MKKFIDCQCKKFVINIFYIILKVNRKRKGGPSVHGKRNEGHIDRLYLVLP